MKFFDVIYMYCILYVNVESIPRNEIYQIDPDHECFDISSIDWATICASSTLLILRIIDILA